MTGLADRYAGVLLLRADGAALLQHRDDGPGHRHPGMWMGPGGACECGEMDAACAAREMLEETGYRCGPLLLLGTFIDDSNGAWPSVQIAVFCARYDGRQAIACHEGLSMEFVTRARAAELPVLPPILGFWDRAIDALGIRSRDDAAQR